MSHSYPSSLSPSTRTFLLSPNSSMFFWTDSFRYPSSVYIWRAVMAAFCMKMGAPESICPLHLVSPLTSSSFPTANPSLKPVMQNVLENDMNSMASFPACRTEGALYPSYVISQYALSYARMVLFLLAHLYTSFT